MSWGTLFLILFPIAIGLYVGGGYYYNYKYKEMRGVDAVPQLEYWKQVIASPLPRAGLRTSSSSSLAPVPLEAGKPRTLNLALTLTFARAPLHLSPHSHFHASSSTGSRPPKSNSHPQPHLILSPTGPHP
jgi:hypothetical protein